MNAAQPLSSLNTCSKKYLTIFAQKHGVEKFGNDIPTLKMFAHNSTYGASFYVNEFGELANFGKGQQIRFDER